MMTFSREEINSTAEEILGWLYDVPINLAIPALCMALAKLGDEHDLDAACRWIDEFREELNG
jgi:hypothetical protein